MSSSGVGGVGAVTCVIGAFGVGLGGRDISAIRHGGVGGGVLGGLSGVIGVIGVFGVGGVGCGLHQVSVGHVTGVEGLAGVGGASATFEGHGGRQFHVYGLPLA